MEIVETSEGATIALGTPSSRLGGLRKSLSWLLGAQLARLALGFIVGTLVARALGVADYGRLSTALGISTLAAFFAELGLRQVIVKEMAQRPRIAGALMGTGFRLLGILGLLALALCLAAPWLLRRPDLLAPTLLLSTAFLFNGHLAIFSRWDASGEAWRAPRFAIVASLVSNIAKVLCIVAGLGVVAMSGAIALECFVAASLVLWSAWTMGWLDDLRRFHAPAARALLVRAFPHFLAQSGALLLLRLDQIMLNAMSGNEEAGIYGAATRLSELVFLMVPVMVASYLPRLAAIEQTQPAQFRRTVGALLQVLSVAGLAAPLVWWLFGGFIVRAVYGREFVACGPVLFIHCLSSLAYLHGAVRSFVLVTTGKARYGAYAAFAGATVNVALNLWWIPQLGAQGAAWATAAAYYVAWFAGTFLMPGLRWLAWSQLRSLHAPFTLAFSWRDTLAALRVR
jgi:O-antigen/teichoic acid export membrane protein